MDKAGAKIVKVKALFLEEISSPEPLPEEVEIKWEGGEYIPGWALGRPPGAKGVDIGPSIPYLYYKGEKVTVENDEGMIYLKTSSGPLPEDVAKKLISSAWWEEYNSHYEKRINEAREKKAMRDTYQQTENSKELRRILLK